MSPSQSSLVAIFIPASIRIVVIIIIIATAIIIIIASLMLLIGARRFLVLF